ncbi:von Willebrand factor A domain-containing protein 8-like [Otolemur garnettii]|uniref:von Willebrand factor A domain-containing protein 8-like n=1 Tax=Otolemur garnettii TaxID=30611 RepID=UPI000C7E99D2|nr:von Willebrand factor A domain-containing protein 8-like [Otolemur garnettii]
MINCCHREERAAWKASGLGSHPSSAVPTLATLSFAVLGFWCKSNGCTRALLTSSCSPHRPPRAARAEASEPAAPGEGVSGALGPGRFLSPPPGRLTLPGRDAARPDPLAVPAAPPDPMQSRLLLLRAPGGHRGAASRRVRLLLRQVVPGGDRQRPEVRLLHAGAGADTGDTVNIGDVSYKLKTPKNPELVPQNYISDSLAQSVVHHLRWIMQKDLLGQDVFLIGPPGPLRRSIAMQYLELTKREVEYVALSRDTTETDLKQRREIRAGTAFYIDQASSYHTLACDCLLQVCTKLIFKVEREWFI